MSGGLPARLRHDERGGVLVEFASVAPILALLAVGLLQVSMLLYASAAMRTALGEGARTARLYRTPATATSWAGPTATEICNRVTSTVTSLGNADITGLTLTRETNGTANGLTLAMSYNVDLDFIFFTLSPTLSSSRRAYLRSQPNFGSPAYACPL